MIGIIGGIFGGISGTLFIYILDLAQNLREMSPHWIFILPIAGLIIALLRGAPKLIIGSFLTHLGGGSAGREGAVIQLCRIWSQRVAEHYLYEDRKLRKLIIVSMGAGFGAALGAPWAGLIFGFEFNKSKLFRPWVLIHSALAAIIAQTITRLTHAQHFRFSTFEVLPYEARTLSLVLIAGILFGFATLGFQLLRDQYEKAFSKVTPMLALIISGSFLTLLFYLFKIQEFQGLGRETMLQASTQTLPLSIAIKKMILSAITLGAGFQGGEFFPIAFIGSTLGSAFSFIDPSMTALLAALGFVTTYGAITHTPIACTLLAYEMFGWKILPYAMITLWIANRINLRLTKNTV